MRVKFLPLAVAALLGATATHLFASSHLFESSQIQVAIASSQHLSPGDKQSVTIAGVTALAEYMRVQVLPDADEYALVFKIKKW